MDQFAKDRKSYSDPSYKQEASSSNKLCQFFMIRGGGQVSRV